MKPLRVGINLLFLQPNRNRGTESYVHGLLSEWSRLHPDNPVLFLIPQMRAVFESYVGCEIVEVPIAGHSRAVRILFEQSRLAKLASELNCDVLFCPGYLSPIRPTLPTVVTIHDTQFRDVPQCLGWGQKFIYNRILPRAVRSARAILTVSNFSKAQIGRHLGVSEAKIHVTHEAAKPWKVSARNCREKLGIDRNYLLTVGANTPHKNLRFLISAFLRCRSEYKLNHQLVLAGAAGESSDEVRFTGYLDDAELRYLYENAHGFIMPSLYEGFGLPVLEAMIAGIPTAISTAGSLPEISGGASLCFSPVDSDDIEYAIRTLLTDIGAREKLVHAGKKNLERFSWKRCCNETLRVLKAVQNSDLKPQS